MNALQGRTTTLLKLTPAGSQPHPGMRAPPPSLCLKQDSQQQHLHLAPPHLELPELDLQRSVSARAA